MWGGTEIRGLIPAHAGKTAVGGRQTTTLSAHPRSRGENDAYGQLHARPLGSSPLTRGKRCLSRRRSGQYRLIPAHAGKTEVFGLFVGALGAHPRSRGENPPAVAWRVWSDGSSPLTRGKHQYLGWYEYDERLIPAHAGKTSRGPLTGRAVTAHPRSRGENYTRARRTLPTGGSSPLTRGKRAACQDQRSVFGLIPAHAGKTRGSSPSRCSSRAHPRSRGENFPGSPAAGEWTGSSPLTRGKQALGSLGSGRERLIPAHAGKTGCGPDDGADAGAHPRSRGENGGRVAGLRGVRGSSPLTRGKHGLVFRVGGYSGLIPAHAGKTP